MNLFELVVVRRVGDGCEVKDRVEPFIAELFSPIERGQILRDEIAAISGEIFEITGAKIIDHRDARVRKSLLQRQREIGTDETGAAGDHEVDGMISRRHRQICCALIK